MPPNAPVPDADGHRTYRHRPAQPAPATLVAGPAAAALTPTPTMLTAPNPTDTAPPPASALTAPDHALATRDRRTESGFRPTLAATRRAIDASVFECLVLTPGAHDAVYNAACAAIVKHQTAAAKCRSGGGWRVDAGGGCGG